jgi:hypothetical protein
VRTRHSGLIESGQSRSDGGPVTGPLLRRMCRTNLARAASERALERPLALVISLRRMGALQRWECVSASGGWARCSRPA